MAQHELARMTWREAGAARDRYAVVLIPMGTLEQNGSVAPLAVDTLVAEEVSKRVAAETGALVAPAIAYGYSPPFRHFPGTVSVSPDTLRSLVFDVCLNLIENGFVRLVLVTCHVFNEPIIEHAARDIREQLGVLVGCLNPVTLAQAASRDLYAGRESTWGHGAEPIASMLRSFDADALHLENAQADNWKDFQGLKVTGNSRVRVGSGVFTLYFGTDEVAETGGTGDPSASDPARGEEIMSRVVSQVSEFVRAFARLNVTEEE